MLRKSLIKPALDVTLWRELAVQLDERNEESLSGGTAAPQPVKELGILYRRRH